MTLPGSNYNGKPYVDDDSLLPPIGARVRSLKDGPTIDAIVTDVDEAGRRIKISGTIFHPHGQRGDLDPRGAHLREDVAGWCLWQDMEVAT
jgi:hypothetical protein